jgi:uncharacterized protein with beta-barrel porin domain
MTLPPVRLTGTSLLVRQVIKASAAISLLGLTSLTARADLTDLLNAGQLNGYNEIRRQSAIANQAVYDQLKAAGCDDAQIAPTATCGNSTYLVWRDVREVVHNANVISNALNPNGALKPTLFTLGRNVAQLGGALQWCNGEEFASLNSLSSSFIASQGSSLATRITALRLGAGSMHASNFSLEDNQALAANSNTSRGGGASADSDDDYDYTNSPWSAWGLFGNGSYVKGQKIATGSEEGFDYKGPSANIGVDKRLNQHWVIGGMVGYQKQSMDFTPFAPTFAPVGSSDLTGFSVLPYLMYESDRWYLNLSVGYQHMNFDTNRLVNYGTQPGQIVPTPVAHKASDPSKATATSISSFDTVGFSIRPVAAWVIEPSLSFDYQHIGIGRFSEQDPNNQGFSFLVDSQTVNSLEGIPELRTQFTFTPGFGVWTPYVDVQWHHQFNTNPRTINAVYAGAQNILTSAASFNIKTDELDPWYQVYSAGISAVLRGSSTNGSHNSGGFQMYLAYRRFEGLKNYEQKVYTAGFRYEF